MVMVPVVAKIISRMEFLRLSIAREQAFQIAEAGRNYYEWHFLKYPYNYIDTKEAGTEANPIPAKGATEQIHGPFTHDYIDTETQKLIGSFDLYITEPVQGGDSIIIESRGKTFDYPNIYRTVTARYYRDSVAQYAVLTNSPGYIFTDIQGKFYSKEGIRDIMPSANAQIISEKCDNSNCSAPTTGFICPAEYNLPCNGVASKPPILNGFSCPLGQTCPTFCDKSNKCVASGGGKPCTADSECPYGTPTPGLTYCSSSSPSQCVIDGSTGKYCSNSDDCASISTVDARNWWTKNTDPAVAWTSTISNTVLATIKAQAILGPTSDTPGYYIATSGATINLGANAGCSIEFKVVNGVGLFDVYKITDSSGLGPAYSDAAYFDGTLTSMTAHADFRTDYTARTQINCTGVNCSGNSYIIPDKDLVIYVENSTNNLWVEGTIKGRATVATAVLSSGAANFPSIYIPNNILYDSPNDKLGLISQNYILISHDAPSNITISGVLITQYKSIGRLFYTGNGVTCNNGTCSNISIPTACSSSEALECKDTDKGSLTTFGSFISNGKSYFSQGGPNRGYTKWNFNFDSGLLSAPPPHCPEMTSKYKLNYWKLEN